MGFDRVAVWGFVVHRDGRWNSRSRILNCGADRQIIKRKCDRANKAKLKDLSMVFIDAAQVLETGV